MAWVENEHFFTGFLYVSSNLLSMSNPLTNFNPANPVGIVVDIYVSVVALLLFGIVLNVVNLFQVPFTINRKIGRCVTGDVIIPFVAITVFIPLSIGVVAIVFGSVLAVVEGWNVEHGIYYVIGNLLGLGTPLTDVLPATVWGDILDVIISSLALGSLAVFVDYVTVLNPARYIRNQVKIVLRRLGIMNLAGDGRSSIFFPNVLPAHVLDAEEEEEQASSEEMKGGQEEDSTGGMVSTEEKAETETRQAVDGGDTAWATNPHDG